MSGSRDVARRAAARLPGPVKSAIQIGVGAVDPVTVRRYRRRTRDMRPVPPVALRARVGAEDPGEYLDSGERHAGLFEEALAAAGRSLDDAADVLDLACGSGRVLAPLARRHPGPRYAGCDIDGPAIAWLRRHHPEIDARVNAFAPPLPWPDASFDLVLSFSLFSHLDESAQWAWLREVHRVLRPGGAGILTVHGPRGFDRIASGGLVAAVPAEAVAAHAPLQPDGFVFVPVAPTRWNALRFAGKDAGFGLSFHGLGYIERRWPEVFTTARVVASGSLQEAVLVEP